MLLPDQVVLELVVRDVDVNEFAPLFSRLHADGVTFTTLATAQARCADWLERFTELDNATRSETGDPAVPRTPEVMRHRLVSFELDPEACFLALDGERWIGYTLLDPKLSRDGRLEQGWTGVCKEHRQRGIGTALKLLGVEYARAHGYRAIVTAPRRQNVASFTMSTHLGFRPDNTAE
ncbi:MAG TPA: GNAT family N-acetyltransferase [Longimicrobium sp.]|jgi:GNAT superfamily N-acetyltransferase